MPRPVLRRITRTTTRVKTRDTCHDHYHGASAQALTMVLWRVLWPPLPWCYNPCQDTWHVTHATIYATTPTKTPRHTSTTRVRTRAKSHTWHVSSPVRWCVPQPPTIVPCPEPRHVTHVPIRARHAMTHPMVARPVLRNVIRGHNHCHGAWPEKTQHVPPPVPWGTPICHGATTYVKKNMMCAKMSRPLPWCVAMVQHTMRHATAHAMTRGMTPTTARSKKRDACHGHYPHLTCHRPCHQACGRHNAHARTHDAAHATFTYVMVA